MESLKITQPQKSFSKFKRNNFNDDSIEFYDATELDQIKDSIKQLKYEDHFNKSAEQELVPYRSGNFIFIEDLKTLEVSTEEILQERSIGIDVEQTNNNSYLGYICLIQISTSKKNYIIDAIKLHDNIKPYLKKILVNPEIIKVFYSGGTDLMWLNRDFGLFVVNYFDVYTASVFLNSKRDNSLVALMGDFCKHKIEKSEKKKFQLSDWRVRPLSIELLDYAIVDAHYLCHLRSILLEEIHSKKMDEKFKANWEQMQTNSIKLFKIKEFNATKYVEYFDTSITPMKKALKKDHGAENSEFKISFFQEKKKFLTLCQLRDEVSRAEDLASEDLITNQQLFDFSVQKNYQIDENAENLVKFMTENKVRIQEINEGTNLIDFEAIATNNSEKLMKIKSERREKMEKLFTTKKIPYENCKILAPDGQLLCFTNREKTNWYLKRDLAILVTEDPLVIRLKFEPNGRGHSDMNDMNISTEEYLKENRVNQCVICGRAESLLKYHVVPILYRQHFPLEMKSHRAYDLLLLCFRCLEKACKVADKFKTEVAVKYDVPLIEFNHAQELKTALEGLIKGSSSYMKNKDKMPENRIKKYKSELKEEFMKIKDDQELSDEVLDQFKNLSYEENGEIIIDEKFLECFKGLHSIKSLVKKTSNKDFGNMHGKLVVNKLKEKEDLQKFIDEWRMNFVHNLDPQFLPGDWDLVLRKRFEMMKQLNDKIN